MSTAHPIRRPAVPRGKRERTRQRLIETAAHLIREKGYANLSMEQVAAQAGVSRGSIYGNFKDRNELIVAVAFNRMPRIMLAPMQGASLREQLREMGRMVAKAARENRDNTVYWITYMLHVLGDKQLKQRAALQGREMRKQVAKQWSEVLPADELSMPIEMLVKVLTTLTTSMIVAHSMTPDDIDEKVIVAAFEAFAGNSTSPRAKKSRQAGALSRSRSEFSAAVGRT